MLRRYKYYLQLIRFDKPVGIFLILWPSLTALWLATGHWVGLKLFLIFTIGAFVMRSAGCIVNDIADRHIDSHVSRTKGRPLAAGHISLSEALILLLVLCVIALYLVLLLNPLCLYLAIVGLALTVIYPFTKRWLDAPQLILGFAFAVSVLIAFAAVQNQLPKLAWCYYVVALLWPIVYDTMYAMVDKEDDIRLGVRSTAILFGQLDIKIIVLLQGVILLLLVYIGVWQQFQVPYYLGLLCALLLFIYQYCLIRHRERAQCFQAFLNNQWALFAVFVGVVFGI